jgi:hypothetical protein
LLPKDNFNKILSGNERVILRDWKRRGLIDAMPDNHMARRRLMGGKSVSVYKIKMPEQAIIKYFYSLLACFGKNFWQGAIKKIILFTA